MDYRVPAFGQNFIPRARGRGLNSTQPNSDGCELDERQIVGCEFVIPGCDTPTLLDLVEEPFDQNPRAI